MPRSCCAVPVLLVLLVGIAAGGCASYTTPGGPADFRALGITPEQAESMTDGAIAARLNRKPAAAFPAVIAAVRIQAPGYYSYSARAYGEGRYSVLTVRDVETDEQFGRLARLPMVAGIAPINRLVLPKKAETEMDLRSVAADLQADILLLYTFDTEFGSETTVPALGTITLGLFPSEQARVTSTASAAFVDTRTGFIYGLAEATVKTDQAANKWTTREAIDQSRRRAEKEAFDRLVVELETTWRGIAARYGPVGVKVSSARTR